MTPREIRFAIDGLTGIVVISVAGALALLTWRLGGEGLNMSPAASLAGSYVPPAPAPDISGIINLPPFGRAVIASSAAAASSDMVLHGILAAYPSTASIAMIATAGGETVAYRLREPLPDGSVVEAIAVDYVILRRGEELLALYFPGDERAGKVNAVDLPGAAPAAPPTSGPGVAGVRSLLPPSVRGAPAAPAPNAPPPAPRNAISGASLFDGLGATVTPQGYQVGTTISPRLREAGLAPGDVVASVDGMSPSSLASDPRQMAQMMSDGQARLEVLRGGNRVIVSVPVQ